MDQILNTMDTLLDSREEGDIGEGLDDFVEGIERLRSNDSKGAMTAFRKAMRNCPAPYDSLAAVSLGTCQQLAGKEGAALRTWKKVADSNDAPHAARYMAWLQVAAAEERRGDQRKVDRARDAIEELGEPADE